jgi:hypothetical protein
VLSELASLEDIKTLLDRQYSLSIVGGHLVVNDVWYVDADGSLQKAKLAAPLNQPTPTTIGAPVNHQMFWSGTDPYFAEALIGLDAGLVSKTNDKKAPFGEGHEEAMRLAFKSIDPADPRAQATDAETIWADTESRSQAQTVDAAVKLATIGVPQEALWERIGASPQEIDRWKALQAEESFLGLTADPNMDPNATDNPQP